jgi:hypothetical protein
MPHSGLKRLKAGHNTKKFINFCENVYTRCPRTRAPEKKGEIFIKEQINNPNEIFFYLERYSRKEQFNSTNQSILGHLGLFPVIVARLHILLRFQ